ncbi:MAG: response regulator [Bacteriovoracaceae bacterium]|nr:response regulator [Bacteriovoracaceae bacterium]
MNAEAENISNGFNVLIVDDEQKICNLIKVFLSMSPEFDKIVTANNSLQAIQKIQNQRFDLVIADFKMEGRTGIELIHQIAKAYQNNPIKYMLISGALQKEDVQLAINSGIKHIVVKPFSRNQLLSKVYEVMNITEPAGNHSKDESEDQ